MRKNNKITFDKKDLIKETPKKNGKIFGLIILWVIFIIGFILVFYFYSIDPRHDEYNLKMMYLIIILAVLIFYAFLGSSFIIGRKTKKKKNGYFLVTKDTDKYKVVDTLSVDNVTISKEEISEIIEENNQPEDSIAFEEQTIEKQNVGDSVLVKNFSDLSKFIDDYFLQNGYKTNFGVNFISAISTSALLFLRNGEKNDVLLDNINSCFNSPKLIIDGQENETITSDYVFFDAINTAHSFKNAPVFLIVKDLDVEKATKYLTPLIPYFNERIATTLELPNNVITIPDNLHVIVGLKDFENIIKISNDLLKSAAIISFECEEDDTVENPLPRPIELGEFNIIYSLDRIKNDYYLLEEYWKQIDTFEEALTKAGCPKFDNKLISRFESYVSIQIYATSDQGLSLDNAFANIVLLPSLKSCNESGFNDENNVLAAFNSIYDDESMNLSRKVIKEVSLVMKEDE